MVQIILISFFVLSPIKGMVVTTIKSNMSDSCRTTIKLDKGKDTIVYFPKNKCPEIRDIITLK